ncbi:MAG: JAB domain-containing protein [Smithella sp.]
MTAKIEFMGASKKRFKRLTEAGKLFEIKVLDHIIVGEGRFISFAERGLL